MFRSMALSRCLTPFCVCASSLHATYPLITESLSQNDTVCRHTYRRCRKSSMYRPHEERDMRNANLRCICTTSWFSFFSRERYACSQASQKGTASAKVGNAVRSRAHRWHTAHLFHIWNFSRNFSCRLLSNICASMFMLCCLRPLHHSTLRLHLLTRSRAPHIASLLTSCTTMACSLVGRGLPDLHPLPQLCSMAHCRHISLSLHATNSACCGTPPARALSRKSTALSSSQMAALRAVYRHPATILPSTTDRHMTSAAVITCHAR
mmetsp:Transcript_24760/g.60045  ORF Transcript_24760/g.60045 Transcript_24760/m.60045 type:complete len:265 (-) Transcript_24760:243-1037(-)